MRVGAVCENGSAEGRGGTRWWDVESTRDAGMGRGCAEEEG